MKNSVCIVIPMFNEENIAKNCIATVMSELKLINSKVGLIIVNAASKDKTGDVLRSQKKKYKNKLNIINLKKNNGYGGAIVVGTKKAMALGYEFVIFMDSDLTNNPKDINRFILKASNTVDCVKASRYIDGGGMLGVPLYRQLISKYGNFISSLFFGLNIKDCTNGFRMVRISLLKNINFHETSFPIILEELYELKKKKARFTSIPVILTSRINSSTHFSYTWNTFVNYFKYAIKALFINEH